MATKIFKSGNLMIINKDSIFDVINLPSFDYKFIGTTYVSFIDKFSNNPPITDLIINIQDEGGIPIGTTEQDIIDYLATQTASSILIDPNQDAIPTEISINSTVVSLLQKIIEEQKITNKLLTKIYQ